MFSYDAALKPIIRKSTFSSFKAKLSRSVKHLHMHSLIIALLFSVHCYFLYVQFTIAISLCSKQASLSLARLEILKTNFLTMMLIYTKLP